MNLILMKMLNGAEVLAMHDPDKDTPTELALVDMFETQMVPHPRTGQFVLGVRRWFAMAGDQFDNKLRMYPRLAVLEYTSKVAEDLRAPYFRASNRAHIVPATIVPPNNFDPKGGAR